MHGCLDAAGGVNRVRSLDAVATRHGKHDLNETLPGGGQLRVILSLLREQRVTVRVLGGVPVVTMSSREHWVTLGDALSMIAVDSPHFDVRSTAITERQVTMRG